MQKNTDSDTLMIKNTVAVIMIVFSVLYIYILIWYKFRHFILYVVLSAKGNACFLYFFSFGHLFFTIFAA